MQWYILVTTRHCIFAKCTTCILQILQFSFYRSGKQFLNNLSHKSSGKMESVTMDVVAEENQEESLGIQDQASGEVQVSMEAEVSQ